MRLARYPCAIKSLLRFVSDFRFELVIQKVTKNQFRTHLFTNVKHCAWPYCATLVEAIDRYSVKAVI